ncbi:MAG: PLP-dependent aminotransferase family protein, partial [Actinobacteria bacterium]|nr:PLP-dependent aminotransferase family protein [Actinomycetota bacterium]
MAASFEFESLLSAEGRRVARGGSMVAAAAAPRVRANLLVGQPAEEALPLAELVEAARQALPDNPRALLYGRRQGAAELIAVVQAKLRRYEGLDVAPERLAITNGSSQAVDLVLRAFVDPDAPMALDEFSFGALLVADRTRRAQHVPWDADGPKLQDLERLTAEPSTRPRLLYTIPTFQNPMGCTMSLRRRREVLALCRARRIPILEDDAYYDLRFEGERVPSLYELDGGTGLVTRTGTFSKILGAGIRLGWLCTSPELARRLADMKPDGGTSPFSSAIASVFMDTHMEAQIARLQALYRAKRDAMLQALAERMTPYARWIRPAGG